MCIFLYGPILLYSYFHVLRSQHMLIYVNINCAVFLHQSHTVVVYIAIFSRGLGNLACP